jgi:hypothetical protein
MSTDRVYTLEKTHRTQDILHVVTAADLNADLF